MLQAAIVVLVLYPLHLHQLTDPLLHNLPLLAHRQPLEFRKSEAQFGVEMARVPPRGPQIHLTHLVIPVLLVGLLRGGQSEYLLEFGLRLPRRLVHDAPPMHEPIRLTQILRIEMY